MRVRNLRGHLLAGLVLTIALMLLAAFLTACNKSSVQTSSVQTSSGKTSSVQTSSVQTSSGKTFHWKYQSLVDATNKSGAAGKYFAEEVTRRTNGRLTIDFYGNSGLGFKGAGILDTVASGALETSEMWGGHVSGAVPILAVKELIGLVPLDIATRIKVANALFPYDQKALDQKGVVLVYASQEEPRQLMFRKPVNSIQDLRGLKIRSYSPAEDEALKLLGMVPTAIDLAEVYGALERGVLDGTGTGYSGIYQQKMYEVAPYVLEVGWGGAAGYMIVNKDLFNSLPTDIQQIVLQVGKDALAQYWTKAGDEMTQFKSKLQNLSKFLPLPAGLDEALKPLVANRDVWANKVGAPAPEMLQLVRQITGRQ